MRVQWGRKETSKTVFHSLLLGHIIFPILASQRFRFSLQLMTSGSLHDGVLSPLILCAT